MQRKIIPQTMQSQSIMTFNHLQFPDEPLPMGVNNQIIQKVATTIMILTLYPDSIVQTDDNGQQWKSVKSKKRHRFMSEPKTNQTK